MKKLAICIPTYNRRDVIDELLARLGRTYYELGWDVYIYDSSTNGETKLVVEEYMEKYDNLYYFYMDSSIQSNLKVFLIYQSFVYMNQYEYIWVIADYYSFSKRALPIVNAYLNYAYDFIVVSWFETPKVHKFYDHVELFSTMGWFLTIYGSCIINVNSVLKDVDWEGCTKKYCSTDIIAYSHFCLYFERLSKMKKLDAINLILDVYDIVSSPLKGYPGWLSKNFFPMICETWPRAVMSLPDCYNDEKSNVVKMMAKFNTCCLTEDFLYELRKEKILNIYQFLKYKSKWKYLTDVEDSRIFYISILPYSMARKHWESANPWTEHWEQIKEFYKRYPKVYIYGCGLACMGLLYYFDRNNMSYQGFVVTSAAEEKKRFHNHPVLEYDSLIFDDPKVGIIIALNEKNYCEVIKQFKSMPYKKRVWNLQIV